jgi:MGT family glycosyltransferase
VTEWLPGHTSIATTAGDEPSVLNLLLTATPLHGHVRPMLAIGRALLDRGHPVTVLTGADYEALVTTQGLGFRALPAAADFRPGRSARPPDGRLRVLQGRDAILDTFVRPLDAQHRALTALLDESPYDAVLADAAYLGALPLLLTRPVSERLPVLGVSATPLSLNSDDCAPFGSALQPGDPNDMRRRNRNIRWLLRHGPLRRLHQELDDVLDGYGVPRGSADYFDHAAYFDTTFHLAPPEMEYPRREMPATIRFVGPIPSPLGSGSLPDWWDDLDDDRPVVHVTQGTMDNGDPRKLLLPAIRGLASENLLVVVATGGLPATNLVQAHGGPLPDNVHVAEFLPYERLLPRTDVVVSNGGFGGVQQALRHGVPLVVAGDTEEKPEVAARVRWSGAGIDLRTGTPSPHEVRRAVLTVLQSPDYQANAKRVSRSIARLGDPRISIADTLEELVSTRTGPGLGGRLYREGDQAFTP